MAVDKLVDSTQLDADLTSVANAIRTKGGTGASLAFPADFISAINAISGGGGLGNVLYSLPQETTFNGTSTYIDTGVALMSDISTDFTLEFTATNGASIGANSPIFHCVTESGSYPGIAIQRKSNSSTQYAMCGLASGQFGLDMPLTSGAVIKAVIRRYHSVDPTVTTSYYDMWYTVDGVLKSHFTQSSNNTSLKNLLIGCYQESNGTKGRFWTGVISNFTIRDIAVSDEYVRDYLFNTSSSELLSIMLGESI